MTDQVDTSQLVGSDPAARQSEPHVDPAVALDPAKTLAPPEKPAKVRRPPAKKRAKAAAAAKDAGQSRRRAASATKAATQKERIVRSDEGRAAYEAAKLNQVATFAELPSREDYRLRFAADGEFLDGARDIKREELVPGGQDRVTFSGKIEFGPEGVGARVTEAWLIAANGEAVCCDLGMGLPTGGGHHAEIPSGHLLF